MTAPRFPFAALGRRAAVLLLGALLAACAAAPPRPAPPSLAERQAEGLRALGFEQGDDGWQLTLAESIAFAFGSAELNADMRSRIAAMAAQLRRLDIRKLRTEGHSDNVGDARFNRDLSQRRADAVAEVFVSAGFASGDIERRGLGPKYPIDSNATPAGRARNRRVEIIVPADALATAP